MSTSAQIRANQENAQHSTGPITESGKAASSLNNCHHGLTGSAFYFLEGEDPAEFDRLLAGLRSEHQPATMTETILVENMARAHWLSQRALRCQHACFLPTAGAKEQTRRLALFIRYQTTHDRAFHRNLTDLLKLRAETRKTEIGFESQKQKDAALALRESAEDRRLDEAARSQRAEDRRIERHKWAVSLAQAKLERQLLQNRKLETAVSAAAAGQNHALQASQAA